MSEFDPDDNAADNAKGEELEKLLDTLDECALGNWDRDFVDDLLKRVKQRGANAVACALTARQKDQLDRMKGQYNAEESESSFL